jgi:hypothetical protein
MSSVRFGCSIRISRHLSGFTTLNTVIVQVHD